jgi:hypothetical protein
MEDDFQDTAKNAWVVTAHKPSHDMTINLAGTLKRWCMKKIPI